MPSILDRALGLILSRIFTAGNLEVTTASGRRLAFGNCDGVPVRIRFADRGAELAFLADPDVKVGELFMDGRLLVDQGSIYDFLFLALKNTGGSRMTPLTSTLQAVRSAARRLSRFNSPRHAKTNVAHHYDLDARLYRLFLDPDLQYSCAYFEHPAMSLEDAQQAKKRHIAAKLGVERGHDVLDIGCGWGGMALYLAAVLEAGHVHGITLSEEQLAVATARADESGVGDRVTFAIEDYRGLRGQYDRIVSVGMFEHVGVGFYQAYFDACRALMKPDGAMLLHTIGFVDVPKFGAPWIEKYIFPGGYIPALSQILPAVERAGLVVADVEVLQVHYAETLRAWRRRFMARRDEAKALYDERFCRMWEFYLAASEAAFRTERMCVFQLLLTPNPAQTPTTRAEMISRENVLRLKDVARPEDGEGQVMKAAARSSNR